MSQLAENISILSGVSNNSMIWYMGLVCLSNLSVCAHNLCKQVNMLENRTLYIDTGNISLLFFSF